MNKKGKNSDFKENKKYINYPFNVILNIYINNIVASKKLNGRNIEGERSSYKQETYEDLSDKTDIPIETIKNYASGKSTPPINTKLGEYKKFAEIFGVNVSELLPENTEDKKRRLELLKKMGIEEETYNILKYKKQNALFGGPIQNTYFDILNDIIYENDFLTKYENEIDTTISKLLQDKNSDDTLKNMSYKEFLAFLNDKGVYELDDMKTNIIRAFEKQLDNFIKSKFAK